MVSPATVVLCIFTVFPHKTAQAEGQGFNPLTLSCTCLADCVKSIGEQLFESIGASVCFVSSCFIRAIVLFFIFSSVFLRVTAPSSANVL